ncbi:G-protein coupled receptor Mth2 [Holothuria leucospilota]|uniref:G-protein coupled receptor Mth2 n=1 Tax=Holothuria leucospilota TaxID=206669 RepID=A0A9Q1BRW0_HOLLE|nr:G-protein coupled receptor Mth2 [Holothuria leucospilota]
MAVWLNVFIQLIIAALVEVMTAQNTTTIVAFSDELPPPSFFGPAIIRPEELCSSFSCSNTFITDLPCQCDDMCKYYGDCCWDATNTIEDFPPSYPTRKLFQCRQLPAFPPRIGVNDAPTGYLMVSRCPEKSNKEIKAQCEEEPDVHSYVMFESFQPIKDKNGLIYKNIYCARCNGVDESDISIWETSHHCLTCPTSLDLLPKHKVQLSSKDCFLSADFQWETARHCSTGFVDSCPRDFSDRNVIEKCQIYFSPGAWNFTWYKNPHCAICHGLNHYWDYFCAPTLTSIDVNENDDVNDDLFGGLWFLRASSVEPTATVEDVHEIRRLSQCTKSFPLHLYLAVTIPNHQLQSQSCPYFGKRLEKCVYNQLQRLRTDEIELSWRQIVKFPNADPFPTSSTLLFYVSGSVSMSLYWESVIAETYTFLLRSKDKCNFQDLYVLQLCGNLSQPEEVITPCENLVEFNSSNILAIVTNDGIKEFLNPWTMKPVKDVSWFAFEASVNESKVEPYKSIICQANGRHNKTTGNMDIEQFERELTSSEPPRRRPRLPLVEQIFSNICISLSIVCLLVTFITYCVFPSLRNSFGITLMNFVAAFAVGQILIHFVTDYVTQWQVICRAVAIVTHFVWLATFAWMNLLAWNLKSTFDNKKLRAINYTSRKTMLGYFCYGWLVPLCVVSVCCILFFVFSDTIPITYGLIRGITCWIGNGWVAFAVVIGPLAVTILVNGVLFFLIVRGIRKSRFRPDDPEERLRNDRGKITELLIYIKISLLMGFVWILGFVISFDKSRILWYTYYALQALQGILIMLLFGFNRRVRSLWKSKLQTIKQKSMSSHTRSSTM